MRALLHCSAAAAILVLSGCGGGGGDGGSISGGSSVSTTSSVVTSPPVVTPPAPVAAATLINSKDASRDFLMRGGWGGSETEIDALVGSTGADWMQAQMALPMTEIVPVLRAGGDVKATSGQRANRIVWWEQTLNNDDVLRSRMVFALSQIVVCSNVSSQNVASSQRMAAYMDILGQHAFGNYRELLEAVTYNPQMGVFLTYRNNRKASNNGLRQPDENYAREIMQLFSIGLVELNPDGTAKLGADGAPIESYTNADISGLARVFTGLNYDPDLSDEERYYAPMTMDASRHSEKDKSFLGTTIAAGTDGETSISQALDTIFEHPNVAPFVSSRLIQRFTQSTPSPDYVARVGAAFEAGSFTTATGAQFGTGQRGDLAATLAAVLLEPQFFDDIAPGPNDGKLREPVLRFAHWAKAMEVENLLTTNEINAIRDMNLVTNGMSQGAFQSPSVFNFYRAGYQAPGSNSTAAGLIAPELQLINEGQVRGYYDYMFDWVTDRTNPGDESLESFKATYPSLTAIAEDPAAMVTYLDEVLISGSFEATTRQRMIDAIEFAPLRADSLEADRLSRARIAVYMAVTSSEYGVQY